MRIAIGAFALIGLLALTACDGAYERPAKVEKDVSTFSIRGGDTTIRVGVITDSVTGCDYVIASWRDPAITPRLGPDGKQVCKRQVQ